MKAIFAGLAGMLLATNVGAATHEVQVFSFAYQPKHLQIQPGDTVIWSNSGGSHNVVADDGSFGNGQPSASAWTFSRTFNQAGEIGYHCSPHGGPGEGMFGTIKVGSGTTTAFPINYGIGGTWYNPATSGQGFFIEIVPSLDLMVFSWFTWSNSTAGAHDWLTGIGPIDVDQAAVTLQRTAGGRFNDPTPVTNAQVGSATVRFADCNTGTVTFQRSDNGTSGTIPIQRLTTTPAACTSPGTE